MIAVVAPSDVEQTLASLKASGEDAWLVGEVSADANQEVHVD
jgi:phosphoribosylaminoimidazole (AIR) synthetase